MPREKIATQMHVVSIQDVRSDEVVISVSNTWCCGDRSLGGQFGETFDGGYIAQTILTR
jgi:hypothetical protein